MRNLNLQQPKIPNRPGDAVSSRSFLARLFGRNRKLKNQSKLLAVKTHSDSAGDAVSSGISQKSLKEMTQIIHVTIVGTQYNGQEGRLRYPKQKLYPGKVYDVILSATGERKIFDGKNLEKCKYTCEVWLN